MSPHLHTTWVPTLRALGALRTPTPRLPESLFPRARSSLDGIRSAHASYCPTTCSRVALEWPCHGIRGDLPYPITQPRRVTTEGVGRGGSTAIRAIPRAPGIAWETAGPNLRV